MTFGLRCACLHIPPCHVRLITDCSGAAKIAGHGRVSHQSPAIQSALDRLRAHETSMVDVGYEISYGWVKGHTDSGKLKYTLIHLADALARAALHLENETR